MRYVSVFSGIGGLEDRHEAPVICCESDDASKSVLRHLYPSAELVSDVTTFNPPPVEVVAGGWPCQDLTPAGRLGGLLGSRSSLFFELVRVAREAGAHTLVAENVPHLLKLNGGDEFSLVLRTLTDAGFKSVAWRTLDARQFGLPQKRPRVYLVASRHPEIAKALHRPIDREWLALPPPHRHSAALGSDTAFGFYWTAGGKRSLCLGCGYTPALKVGSGTSKGTSPVAVFYRGTVRKLTPAECLGLQGFSRLDLDLSNCILGDVLRMAGNAVPRPVGEFVMASVKQRGAPEPPLDRFGVVRSDGALLDGVIWSIRHSIYPLAVNLDAFLDTDCAESLSPQAAAGLLTRLIRTRRHIPLELFDCLHHLSLTRTRLKGTRINSFSILHEELDAKAYRSWLERGAAGESGSQGCAIGTTSHPR